MVAQLIRNQQAAGSSPAGSFDADIVQLAGTGDW